MVYYVVLIYVFAEIFRTLTSDRWKRIIAVMLIYMSDNRIMVMEYWYSYIIVLGYSVM